MQFGSHGGRTPGWANYTEWTNAPDRVDAAVLRPGEDPMKDNALRIMLFIYCLSGSLVAVDVLIAGPLGIQIMTFDGEPAGPQIYAIAQRMAEHDMTGHLAEASGELDAGSQIDRATKSLELGMDMTVEMLKLLTGLYAFDVLTVFGIPYEITVIIIFVYAVLVCRAIIGYMPAIASGVHALVAAGRAVFGAIGSLRP